jgi:hypothetical protein
MPQHWSLPRFLTVAVVQGWSASLDLQYLAWLRDDEPEGDIHSAN